jgi:hypothetical protein
MMGRGCPPLWTIPKLDDIATPGFAGHDAVGYRLLSARHWSYIQDIVSRLEATDHLQALILR